jgi:hypothetical protein
VLSTLRWFRDEYEAHIFERKCPAGACRELLTYTIDRQVQRLHDVRPAVPGDAIVGCARSPALHHRGQVHRLRRVPEEVCRLERGVA